MVLQTRPSTHDRTAAAEEPPTPPSAGPPAAPSTGPAGTLPRSAREGGRRLLLSLVLAAASAGGAALAQEAPTGDPLDRAARRALDEAPPRAKLGRIRGARIRSTVEFADPEAGPHTLTFSAGFPARSRLTLARDRWRVERFQLGETWFGLDRSREELDADPSSELLAGGRLESTRVDVAMRRALFFWPDEGDLVGAGFTRTAKVGDIGVLIVSLDRDSGRPTHVRAFGQDGKVMAEFRGVEWARHGERWWPASFEFHTDGTLLWRETVERVEDGWNFTDVWFLPVDRTRGLVGQPNDERLRMVPRPATWTRTYALDPGPAPADWRGPGRRALESAARELEGTGLRAAPAVEVVLDGSRRPTALRVTTVGDGLGAEGWTRRAAQLAWVHRAERGVPGTSAFEAVRGAASSSGEARGLPHLVLEGLSEDEGAVRVGVVQPFEAAETPVPGGGRTP